MNLTEQKDKMNLTEQERANNILKLITSLPGAQYLLEYVKSGPTRLVRKPLFDWLLTGQYTEGILDTIRDGDAVERIVNIVVDSSMNTSLSSKILRTIISDIKDERLYKYAKVFNAIDSLHNKYSLNFLDDSMYQAIAAARVVLFQGHSLSRDVDYVKEFIIDPKKVNLVNNIKFSFEEDLANALIEYFAANTEIPTQELQAMSIDQLLELLENEDPGKSSEDIQEIYNFLHGAPKAPEVPNIGHKIQ